MLKKRWQGKYEKMQLQQRSRIREKAVVCLEDVAIWRVYILEEAERIRKSG